VISRLLSRAQQISQIISETLSERPPLKKLVSSHVEILDSLIVFIYLLKRPSSVTAFLVFITPMKISAFAEVLSIE
jgi:hypothetical protein